jgi:hypothetical protein
MIYIYHLKPFAACKPGLLSTSPDPKLVYRIVISLVFGYSIA